MFHLIFSLAFVIPNIYLFFRIKNLFISKGYKLWYTFVYLILASVYPLFEGSVVAGYILPFFLYLFLSVLIFDLFLLINLLIGIIPAQTRRSLSFRSYTLCCMIIISAIVVTAGAINFNTIRISEYRITVPKRSANIDHLRVVFVADLHMKKNTPLGFMGQFVRKANNLHPDIMLYGGDMLEGDSENETSETVEKAIRKIHSKYGAYAVTGNHEFYGNQQHGNFFSKAGIILLCDTIVRVDSSFYLAGRYDKHFEKRKTLSELIGLTQHDLPMIVLDHRPSEMQEASLTAADVQFSGHTHNGQLFPGNLITKSIFDLSWGYKKIKNTHFFVTSGLRLWGPPVRTTGKSEIMVVDISFK